MMLRRAWALCSILAVVGAFRVTAFSLFRKSPAPMVDTWVRESWGQGRIRGGFSRAYSFTERGARRSEFPWRRTGLTALPLTLS